MFFLKNNIYIFNNLNYKLKKIFMFITISFLFILYKLYVFQINNFNYYYKKSYNNSTKLIKYNPIRGIIFDINNNIIAYNKIIYNIKVYPYKINNIEEEIKKIKNILNLNKYEIKSFYKRIKNSYSFESVILKYNIDNFELNNFIANKINFPYTDICSEYKRIYPYKNIFSHVIGYVSLVDKETLLKNNFYNKKNYLGRLGIEKKYENILRGENGIKEIKVNNKGKFINIEKKIYSKSGNDIYLTLDIDLQKKAYELIQNNKGCIIVSDVRDGKILSMVSNPSFDPNIFIYNKNKIEELFKNKDFPIINRSIQGIYPPASTIKPFISIYALYDKIIKKNTLIYDPGWWKIPNTNQYYNDWYKNGRGYINIIDAIAESSDIFFYNISYIIGIEKIYNFMSNFNFGKKTGIDLPYEKNGILPNKIWKFNKIGKKWYIGDTISVGIGQGYFSVTPIQILNALITLINNGISKQLHILRGIYDKKTKTYFKNIINKKKSSINYIDNSIWDIVKLGMYNVVNSSKGTANKYFKNAKYKIACKTGTAQVYGLNNKKYINKNIPYMLRDHKLIMSYAPFENPKIAIIVILENGGIGKYNAFNITKKIFDFLLIEKKYE